MENNIGILFAGAFLSVLAGNLLGGFIRWFASLVWEQWKNEEC